jgi:hypothetical protein
MIHADRSPLHWGAGTVRLRTHLPDGSDSAVGIGIGIGWPAWWSPAIGLLEMTEKSQWALSRCA